MSSERLENVWKWLDRVIERGEAAGFVTLVARRGKVVHFVAHGNIGMKVKKPMPKDALFDLASMTKPVTVVAALMLLEEGRFLLTDPISKYLPEFEDQVVRLSERQLVPPDSEVTVHNLFTHTSGIGANWSRAEVYEFSTLEEYIEALAEIPLSHQPGSTWFYGYSHDVLGYLVQTVTGQPLAEFIQQRILDPLGMEDTHYWPPSSKDDRRAVLVVEGRDDLDSTSRRPLKAAEEATLTRGASGLYSTAADYWRFCQMLLNGGELDGERLLGPRTVARISQEHIPAELFDRPGTTFGLGHAVTVDPAEQGFYWSEGSYYWGGSQGTVFWVDPKEQLTGVLMVQRSRMDRINQRQVFAEIVYAAIVD